MASLRRVKTVHRLNWPEASLSPYSLLRAGIRSGVAWPRVRERLLVALAGDRLVGFAQFRPALPDQRWHLDALGAATGVYEAAPVWEDLVAHGVFLAGLHGVKRLYAKIPDGSPVEPAVTAIGFAKYATETVMVAHAPAPRAGSRLRPQEPTDTWAIYQLHNAATPRQVQYAEALTDPFWSVGPNRNGGLHRRGWLVEDGHDVVGYVRAASRGGNHVLELLFHPERPDVLGDLVDGAIAGLGTGPIRRVACSVRGYQSEAIAALESRGFAPYLEQAVHVKYTAVAARLPMPEAVVPAPVYVGVREKMPRRVPTFLQGQPGDDPAS